MSSKTGPVKDMGSDPVEYAVQVQGSRELSARTVTDGRMAMVQTITVVPFFHQVMQRPAFVLPGGIEIFGGVHKVKDALWMLELPFVRNTPEGVAAWPSLRAYETIAWHDDKDWVIIAETRPLVAAHKPWQRAYHLVVD